MFYNCIGVTVKAWKCQQHDNVAKELNHADVVSSWALFAYELFLKKSFSNVINWKITYFNIHNIATIASHSNEREHKRLPLDKNCRQQSEERTSDTGCVSCAAAGPAASGWGRHTRRRLGGSSRCRGRISPTSPPTASGRRRAG